LEETFNGNEAAWLSDCERNTMTHSFSMRLMRDILHRRHNEVEGENVDPWRFPRGLGNRFDHDQLMKILEFVASKCGELDDIADLLYDNESRNLLGELIAYRALGYKHVRLPTNTSQYWQRYEQAAKWKSAVSEKSFPPFELGLYEMEFMNTKLSVVCWLGNAVFSFLAKQYYLNRRGIRVQPEPGEWIIDGGACFGDTAISFAAAAGEGSKVFAFEAMPAHCQVITENLERNPELAQRIEIVDRALADGSNRTLLFSPLGAGSRPTKEGTVSVSTITIDDFVRERQLRKLDFIKMDIEGSELAALRGAADSISRFAPKLAISVYHNLDDVITIPKLIRQIRPDYELFLDHYTLHWEETILYAAPHSRLNGA